MQGFSLFYDEKGVLRTYRGEFMPHALKVSDPAPEDVHAFVDAELADARARAARPAYTPPASGRVDFSDLFSKLDKL